jgi:hypothetical protein
VRTPEQASPPPSPPPLSELYPELRVVVWRMRLRREQAQQ